MSSLSAKPTITDKKYVRDIMVVTQQSSMLSLAARNDDFMSV